MNTALPAMDISAPAELVKLDTLEQYDEEGKRLQHAVRHYFNKYQKDGVTVYSVRQNGASVFTLSVKPDSTTDHIVGLHNRPPSADEMTVITALLDGAGIKNCYDPRTLG